MTAHTWGGPEISNMGQSQVSDLEMGLSMSHKLRWLLEWTAEMHWFGAGAEIEVQSVCAASVHAPS